MEGGLSCGGDETPLLPARWVCWLVLRRSSSLKLLPEFCLKKPGLEACRQKNHFVIFHNYLNQKFYLCKFSLCCRNLGSISARRGGQRLLGALTLQLNVFIWVLLGRVCRENKNGSLAIFLSYIDGCTFDKLGYTLITQNITLAKKANKRISPPKYQSIP